MEQQTTVTGGDAVSVDTEAATNRQSATGAGEAEPQLARAREAQRTSSRNPLPDTDRYREALADWRERSFTVLHGLRDGPFWDEQPPSPRELVHRCQESPWLRSEYQALKILRWTGCVISILWSVPLYGLAIVGQRFGRALTVALTLWAFWNLI
jgi:hypothetical protein